MISSSVLIAITNVTQSPSTGILSSQFSPLLLGLLHPPFTSNVSTYKLSFFLILVGHGSGWQASSPILGNCQVVDGGSSGVNRGLLVGDGPSNSPSIN